MSKPSDLRISDHAVLRWLERIEGVKADDVRARIRLAASIGVRDVDGYIHFGRGCLAVEDGAVKTVLGPGQTASKAHRNRLYKQRRKGVRA